MIAVEGRIRERLGEGNAFMAKPFLPDPPWFVHRKALTCLRCRNYPGWAPKKSFFVVVPGWSLACHCEQSEAISLLSLGINLQSRS
jgi:hypothetical protein